MIDGRSALKKEFVIQNKVGLHSRPAALFVQTARKFKSDITVEKDGEKVNAKSILGILSLGAEKGAHIAIEAKGEDEKKVIHEIKELIKNKFGED